MKIFTVTGNGNHSGAVVSILPYYGKELPALIVGSLENGCKMGVLKLSEQPKNSTIYHGELDGDDDGYKLKPSTSSKYDDKVLVVLRTHVYKGGRNFHSGDRKNAICVLCEIEYDIIQDSCGNCGRRLKIIYQNFPGKIIAKGTVRDSKRPVYGSQYICVIKKNVIFRTAYDGFSFGKGGCHYHWYNGEKMITCNWEERKKFYLF